MAAGEAAEVPLLVWRARPRPGGWAARWALLSGAAALLALGALCLRLGPASRAVSSARELVVVPSRPQPVACYCGSPAMIQQHRLASSRLSTQLAAAAPTAADTAADTDTDSDADSDSPEADAPEATFATFGLHPFLNAGLRRMGYRVPSDVQAAAIPRVMAKANVAVQSHTGSGKTAVFLLPILTEVIEILEAGRPTGDVVTHLIVAPSQELCMQIVRMAEGLVGMDRRWIMQQLIGGANIERQKEALRAKRPLLIVATPGRLAAMLGTIVGLHHVQLVALDEADALADRAFQDDMKRIMQHVGKRVPGGPRFLLTSASLTDGTLARIRELWHLPEMCTVLATSAEPHQAQKMRVAMSPTLTHWHVMAEPRTKVDSLRRVLVALNVPKVLVFMNEARRLKDTLFRLTSLSSAFAVAILHSKLPKDARRNAIQSFQRGETQVLVVTDVLARGMDLNCDAVINLEVPEDAVTYAHRAGRTGRMGREGAVVTLVCPFETITFGRLAASLNVSIPQRNVFAGEFLDPSEAPARKSAALPPAAATPRREPEARVQPNPSPTAPAKPELKPAAWSASKPGAAPPPRGPETKAKVPLAVAPPPPKPVSTLKQRWDALKQPAAAPAAAPAADKAALPESTDPAPAPNAKPKRQRRRTPAPLAPWQWQQRLPPEQREALEAEARRRREAERQALAAAAAQLADNAPP